MGLTKAYLELVEANGPNPPSTTATGTRIDFQFNPEKIVLGRSAHWTKDTNSTNGVPRYEYKGPKPTTMKLEMFLDASEKEDGDVSTQVDALLEACAPTEKSKSKGTPLPLFAIFGWDRVYFRGFIERVSATYTMFRETGKPVRATCDIDLTETPPATNAQNPTSGARGAQAIVQLVDGESLAAVAYREYGDAGMWRLIAEANSIDDPLRVRPGIQLVVPPVTEAAR